MAFWSIETTRSTAERLLLKFKNGILGRFELTSRRGSVGPIVQSSCDLNMVRTVTSCYGSVKIPRSAQLGKLKVSRPKNGTLFL